MGGVSRAPAILEYILNTHAHFAMFFFVIILMKRMAAFLPGYAAEIGDEQSRTRYREKLSIIENIDPYDLPKAAFEDNVDAWPATTYIHVGMYLVFSPSPYTSEDLLNYKSMECYQRFTSGWVREIRVKVVQDNRIVIAKVGRCVAS